MNRKTHLLLLLVTLVYAAPACGQYPKITPEVAAEAAARKEAADRRSDKAWEAAWPNIQEWQTKGKPFIPDADHPDDLPQATIPAFPGAEGGGMYSFGGRGGRVFVVSNLNDRGPGSFREAAEAGGPRIVVFNVAGIIKLTERIRIRAPYITIDGSSAPGNGICIAGDTVELETHDVIIRHMRFRRGATWVGDRNDALGGNPIGNIMIDHVSASWGLDENMSMYRHMYRPPDGSKAIKMPTVNITIQNSIFSEALDTYNHAFGSTIGGYNSTFHHNLWACNTGRNPSVGMIYDFNFINNVVFNWRHRTTDGGDHRSFYNIINNYFKPGPVTDRSRPISHRILKPESRRSKEPNTDFGKAYVAGNVVDGNSAVTADNWNGGVQVDEEDGYNPDEILPKVRSDEPYPHAFVTIHSAEEAYENVLQNAGATKPIRDAVDRRVVTMVRSGEVTYPEGKGIITDIAQVGGYPEYRGQPNIDRDHDGMPDDWERAHQLDPKNPDDAGRDSNGDGYTHIEEFLYGLDPHATDVVWLTPRTYEDRFEVGK